MLWVDVVDEPLSVCEPILRDTLGFHRLAIEDALEERHSPKVDDWGDHLYLVLHAVDLDSRVGLEVAIVELDLFLGANYVVTHRTDDIAAADRVWGESWTIDGDGQGAASHLCFLLTEAVVDTYSPAIDALDDAVYAVEGRVLEATETDLLGQIIALRRSLLHFQRVTTPQLAVLSELSTGKHAAIDARDRKYFRDARDHLVRVAGLSEMLLERSSGALEIYFSVASNQMTAAMRTLTLITVLFMPMVAITGFFGMNFFAASAGHSSWTGNLAFAAVLCALAALPFGMYVWMKRRVRM